MNAIPKPPIKQAICTANCLSVIGMYVLSTIILPMMTATIPIPISVLPMVLIFFSIYCIVAVIVFVVNCRTSLIGSVQPRNPAMLSKKRPSNRSCWARWEELSEPGFGSRDSFCCLFSLVFGFREQLLLCLFEVLQ